MGCRLAALGRCVTRGMQISHMFFIYCTGHHRDLHSFPTRRSSDLAFRQWGSKTPGHPEAFMTTGVEATTGRHERLGIDRKSTRLNSSHTVTSYAVFCLKKKNM